MRLNSSPKRIDSNARCDATDRRIRNLTPSRVEFGVIPKEHWFQPDWIDKEKAQKAMEQMERQNVKYGGTPFPPPGFCCPQMLNENDQEI